MGEKKGLFNFLKLDSLFDHLTGYIDSKIELVKVEIREEAAGLISRVIVGFLLFFLAWFFVMFLSIAGGFYFGTLLNDTYLGFLVVAGIYFLLFLLLFLLRDHIGIKEFFEKKSGEWIKPKK